jgi:putative Mg2+ transporter-C (MgtC) family protein
MHWGIDVDTILRMVAAVAVGGAIGVNRDIHGKPTGIRAHALVSLGAAIFVIAGSGPLIGADHPDALSRVIQGIVAGIGFLGGGVILRGTTGLHVYHLVTAASLWVTTGVGVLCGLGEYLVAGAATLLVLAVLVIGLPIDRRLYGRDSVKDDDRE